MGKAVRAAIADILAAHPQFDRKHRQLGRRITRSVQRTLDIDVVDDVFAGAVVDDAHLADGGVFVVVVRVAGAVDVAHARLALLTPLVRTRLAQELARKRVPQVRLVAVPIGYGVDDDDIDDDIDDCDSGDVDADLAVADDEHNNEDGEDDEDDG